ncbi:MAG: hypothetical protein M0R17_05390 [Candidatus Omnitrophica bacterium]|jgi:hypothetical protein|nr:hypothetical protein [Candidatus Omnitrophota bacterium]
MSEVISLIEKITGFINPQTSLVIIVFLAVLVIISVAGNVGIDWNNKKITFGSGKNKRSCADCVNYLLTKRTTFETLYYNKQNSILRQQMIFAEHKLLEMELFVGYEFKCNIKDELRRSFKNNGFAERTPVEYEKYIQERIGSLTTMIAVTHPSFPAIIREIYDHAKDTTLRVESELKKLEKDFIKDVDKFIGV